MRRHAMVIVHIEILKSNQCQTTLTASHLGWQYIYDIEAVSFKRIMCLFEEIIKEMFCLSFQILCFLLLVQKL